jgi:hypothetical protein
MHLSAKLLLGLCALLALSGCGTSSLNYNKQQLTLQLDQAFIQLDSKLLLTEYDSYGSLTIRQKILQLKEHNIVVYEDARTDIEYEFEKSITQNIKVIFDAKRTYIIYAKNHLYAYQLLLPNGNILNVIAQQGYSQRLKILYGMQSEQFDSILKTLDPEAKPTYYRDIMTINVPQNAIQSRWNVQKVHFYPLVSPLPRMSAM